jgi:hypothetical protein
MEDTDKIEILNGQDTTTEISEETLAHFRKEAIIAESKITEKINKALEDPETAGRRWFWELLQNAKDSASYNPNKPEQPHKNVKGKTVDVVLTYRQEGENYYLSFEHNGNPFNYTDDPYRFDDVTNLILPVSGKDNEYQTGKFGTGFLSTHILSLKIGVEGVFLNNEQQLKDFNFVIDRTKFTVNSGNDELRKSFIESIVHTLKNSVSYTEHKNIIKSKFTYHLNENIKQDLIWVKKIVEEGLNDLEVLLPLVLCFNEGVKSVTINNEVTNSKTTYELKQEKKSLSAEMKLFHVSVSKNQDIVNILLADDGDIQLATYFETEANSENKFFINLDEIYKEKTKKKIPFLFSSFPLIGSEEFSFPMVINSKIFKPKETRDSISLKNNDNGNQTIIESASALYKNLLANISNEKWKRAFNISDTHITLTPSHKWISDEWHKTKINSTLRESILKEKLVDIPTNKEQIEFVRKPIKENDKFLHFPIDTKKDNLWKYAIDLFPQSVPSLAEVSEWNKVLWDSEKDFKKVNAEFLVKKISEFKGDIKPLATQIFGETENALSDFLDWLHDFVKFIQTDLKQLHLLDFKQQQQTFPILPNREGKLKLLGELNYDKGFFDNDFIESKTLTLHTEFCGKNVTGDLLHKKFDDLNLLPNGREIKETDLASKICEVVNHKIREGKLSNADKTSLGELRNFLFSIQNETVEESDKEKKRKQEKYVKMYSDLDLDKIFLSVVEQDKISSVTKLLESDRNGTIDIKTFEQLAEHPGILAIAEKLLAQQEQDNFDFKIKKEIGDIFEKFFKEKVASYDFLKIKKVEGEEDFEIHNSTTGKDFYVEIKSATNHKTYVELTPDQGRAFSSKENYILCIIPDSNLVTDEPSFLEKAIFNKSVGQLLKDKVQSIDSFETAENGIEIIFETELLKSYKKYKYKYRINEQIWDSNKFDNFLEWLKG